jgi:hypothetical protein
LPAWLSFLFAQTIGLLSGRLLLGLVLPDAISDPLAGGAGWVGAGLLGLVLGWLLLVHLPAKDKQLKDLLEAKDKQIRDLVEAKDRMAERMEAAKDTAIAEQRKDSLAAMRAQTETFVAANAQQRDDYQAALVQTMKRCEGEISDMSRAGQDVAKSLNDGIRLGCEILRTLNESIREAASTCRDVFLPTKDGGGQGKKS